MVNIIVGFKSSFDSNELKRSTVPLVEQIIEFELMPYLQINKVQKQFVRKMKDYYLIDVILGTFSKSVTHLWPGTIIN